MKVYGSTTSMTPVIGGQLYVSSPRWIKSLSLLADLSFFSIRGEKDYVDQGNNSYRKYRFNTFTTALRINALFTFGSGKFRPVFEGGLCAYINAIKNSTLYTELNSAPIYSDTLHGYQLPDTNFLGLNYGAGFDYRISNDHFLFCRITFDRLKTLDVIKSSQLKLGITF